MPEVVLVTELEYAKAEAFFLAQSELDLICAPADEQSLAEAVLRHRARAVILGAKPYRGPLYEALGQSAGAAGAILARFGVGHDGVDKPLARQHGIVVTNTPGVLDASVAEHAMWLLGSLARHVAALHVRFHAGQFVPETGFELCGKTLGVLGFGPIGRRVAIIAHRGFAMRILAVDVRPMSELQRQEQRSAAELSTDYGLELYSDDADAVFRQADAVSIHLPALPATRHFVDARRLGLMKPESFLINTARGSLVDETALYDALAARQIAGAGLDVFEREPYEPLAPEKDLRRLNNVLLTPHVGSNTREANQRMAQASLANVRHFLAGQLEELARVS